MNSMPFPPQAAPSYDPPPPPPPQQSQQQSSIMQPLQPQPPPLQQQPSLQQYPPQPQQIPQPRLSDITTSNNRHPQQQQQQQQQPQPSQAVSGTTGNPYSNSNTSNSNSITPSITVTNNTNHNSHTADPARPTLSRPPYIDSNTNIIYDTDQPEYEGFLTKQSMWLKDWRRRYFLLKGSNLFYCSNEYAGPHGMIDLALCTTVKSADLKSRKRNSFEISTPDTTYLLYADTEQAKDDWIGRVGKAIVRCSSTYHNVGAHGQQRGPTMAVGPNGMPGYGVTSAATNPMDSDDEDIYYEDPNNINPYFND